MAAILEFSDQKHLLMIIINVSLKMMIRWYSVNFVEMYIEKWYLILAFQKLLIFSGSHLGIIYSLIASRAWEFAKFIELPSQIKIIHEIWTLAFIATISITLYMVNGGHLGFFNFLISPQPWFSRGIYFHKLDIQMLT